MRGSAPRGIRWLVLVGLAGVLPLAYYLAVVGGLLRYGAIMVIALVRRLAMTG